MGTMHLSRTFTPTRQAGLDRLDSLAPRLGRAYAAGRNTDHGPDRAQGASLLSPWLRHRLILEQEAVRVTEDHHGPAAEKFVQEVFWRSYFKGWLETHPVVWDRYLAGLAHAQNRLATESGLRKHYEAACAGQTGTACFDAWAQELVATNWLHNHTRMWFASIWIFTLRLPWELGAAFFLRHLLDGDAASNTLSWRWVAGLHTPGKHYVARADNIARYTDGRFNPAGELNEAPDPLDESAPTPTVRLTETEPPQGDVWLLLHDEDLCPETLPLEGCTVRGVAGVITHTAITDAVSAPVTAFASAALQDGLDRAQAHFGVPGTLLKSTQDISGWAGGPVVMPYAPVGPARTLLGNAGTMVRRPWDGACWPHATRGYFGLRTKIPGIVRSLGVV